MDPPFDPDYDGRRAPQDLGAERAILAALLAPTRDHETHPGELLATELDPDDFYLPEHQLIWETWHQLHTRDGVPPDSVLLNEAIVRTRDVKAIRALTDIVADRARDLPNDTLAPQHARIVRDTARLRDVDELATGLRQIVNNARIDQIDAYLGEALQRLDQTVMRFGATTTSAASGYKDLSWVLTGQAPEIEPPRWVRHDAGHALFYAGKVNGVFGDPETAKTWLAQCAIVEALNTGGTAAMVDVDHNGENHTAARLLLLGAHPEAIADGTRFRYYDPEDGDQLRNAITEITTNAPDVFLLDSLGEVFPMLGLNSNDGDELTGGLRLISRPADAGTCVIFIDHLPKSTEARATGFAIGSIAKKRAVRGSYIRAEERIKPAPGQVGKISLFVEKDTAGELRKQIPGGKYLGTFVLDSREPHVSRWAVVREDAPTDADGHKRYTRVMERISRYVEDNDQCTGNEIKDAIGGKPTIVAEAIKTLVSEGFVSVMKGRNRSHLHHSIAHYREAEDDHVQHHD
ncbi:DnaB-like helicase N-terminal domain-containing protein [Nocardioides soli]|uniref:DNA helicase DnaB-like N-terminal domain-containing protein n=1 Tax=Nocardioides soli TaxID=1036020 RepID=A0A7W4YZW6_9ACTN|nr:hypothetical protein [Nocardioides soli]